MKELKIRTAAIRRYFGPVLDTNTSSTVSSLYLRDKRRFFKR